MRQVEDRVRSNPAMGLKLESLYPLALADAAAKHFDFESAMCEDMFDPADRLGITDVEADRLAKNLSETILGFVLRPDLAPRKFP